MDASDTITAINELTRTLRDLGVSRKDISDGFHTFGELYYHRMILFSIVCKQYKSLAWKSWLHDDGTMLDDCFIVGIFTSEGLYSYHYKAEFWGHFDVSELERAPAYDGHVPSDVTRLLNIYPNKKGEQQ